MLLKLERFITLLITCKYLRWLKLFLPLSQKDFLHVVQSTRFLLRPDILIAEVADVVDIPVSACLLSSSHERWFACCLLLSEVPDFLFPVERDPLVGFPLLFVVRVVPMEVVAEKSAA